MSSTTLGTRAFKVVATTVVALGLVGSGIASSAAAARGGDTSVQPHRRPSQRHPLSGRMACVNAFKKAEEEQRASHLREAQDTLFECAQSRCSRRLKDWCMARYTRLRNDIPSVIPIVTDGSGVPLADVKVSLDGKLVASRLDGTAIPVDPGVHELAFEKDGVVFATRAVMAAQGQRNRPISASFEGPRKGAARVAAAIDSPSSTRARPEAAARPPAEKAQLSPQTAGKGQKEPAPAKSSDKPAAAVSSALPAGL